MGLYFGGVFTGRGAYIWDVNLVSYLGAYIWGFLDTEGGVLTGFYHMPKVLQYNSIYFVSYAHSRYMKCLFTTI